MMHTFLERLWQEEGFTAVLVTHDVSEATGSSCSMRGALYSICPSKSPARATARRRDLRSCSG